MYTSAKKGWLVFLGVNKERGKNVPFCECEDFVLSSCGLKKTETLNKTLQDQSIEILIDWYFSGDFIRLEEEDVKD